MLSLIARQKAGAGAFVRDGPNRRLLRFGCGGDDDCAERSGDARGGSSFEEGR
jgi:hypothetical protein